jgi:uncharacterized DUF497 family protein
MALRFQWDPDKARRNVRKHQLTFEEASTAFEDDRSVTIPDPTHSVGEERFLLLGRMNRGRIVGIAFTERSANIDTIRLISVRLADRGERHDYEEGQA